MGHSGPALGCGFLSSFFELHKNLSLLSKIVRVVYDKDYILFADIYYPANSCIAPYAGNVLKRGLFETSNPKIKLRRAIVWV